MRGPSDFRRGLKPIPGFLEDEAGDEEKGGSVDEGGQDFQPYVTVRLGGTGRLLGQAHGHQR
jgi:hypothetical protein